MSCAMVLPTREQEIYSYMNRSFFPPWKTITTTDGLSEDISCYFMGGNNRKKEGSSDKSKQETKYINQSIAPEEELVETELDWRYWAFWSAWISFHGLKEYHLLPESKRFSVWQQEKTNMTVWFQDNFLIAKKEIAKRWDKMTNMDMEDAITGLVSDVNEQESGLKTLLLCWTYYSMTMEDKGAIECIWVVPAKSVYYSFSHGVLSGEDCSSVPTVFWGVFMEILDVEGKRGRTKAEGDAAGSPPRKPLQKQKRFRFRELEKGAVESIRNSMVEFKAVNRPLAAISKYTLKELMETGVKMGLSPPMISVVDEKGAMKLDLAEKVRGAEMELGVVRKPDEKKVLKKELEKVEKWKKGDWYERMEAFCMDAL